MAATEDFSFPAISTTEKPACDELNKSNILSPSLWRISSVVYPDLLEELGDVNINRRDHHQDEARVSSSSRKLPHFEDGHREDSPDEEKMDVLWEKYYFKEERDIDRSRRLWSSPDLGCLDDLDQMNDIGEGSRRRRRRASCTTAITRHKRTSLVALLRALRKLFLLHNLARHKQN